jgi:hypothetical protein
LQGFEGAVGNGVQLRIAEGRNLPPAQGRKCSHFSPRFATPLDTKIAVFFVEKPAPTLPACLRPEASPRMAAWRCWCRCHMLQFFRLPFIN